MLGAVNLADAGVVGMVGTGSSSELAAPAIYCSVVQIPIVSPGSSTTTLIDKTQYPYLLRSIASDAGVVLAQVTMAYMLGVRQAAVLVSLSFESGWLQAMRPAMNAKGIRFMSQTYTSVSSTDGQKELISMLSLIQTTGYRAILLYIPSNDAKFWDKASRDLGLRDSSKYIWFANDAIYEGIPEGLTSEGVVFCAADVAATPARAAYLQRWPEVSTLWKAAVDGWFDPITKLPFYGSSVYSRSVWDTDYAAEGDGTPDPYGMYAYDTVWLFANALDSLLKAGLSPWDGQLLRTALLAANYSITGEFQFDPVTQDRGESVKAFLTLSRGNITGPTPTLILARSTAGTSGNLSSSSCRFGCMTLVSPLEAIPWSGGLPSDGRSFDSLLSSFFLDSTANDGGRLKVTVKARDSFGQAPCMYECAGNATSDDAGDSTIDCGQCISSVAGFEFLSLNVSDSATLRCLSPVVNMTTRISQDTGTVTLSLPQGLRGSGLEDRSVMVAVLYKGLQLPGSPQPLRLISTACSQGTAGTNCTACPAGTVAPLRGMMECRACEAGTFSLPGRSFCTLCDMGKVARRAGSTACESCGHEKIPFLRFTPDNSQSSCSSIDMAYLCSCVAILVCALLATALLISASSLPIPILDVRLSQKGVVIKTGISHGVFFWSRGVRFHHTKIPWFDNPPAGTTYQVQRVTGNKLLLYESSDTAVTQQVERSSGYLTFDGHPQPQLVEISSMEQDGTALCITTSWPHQCSRRPYGRQRVFFHQTGVRCLDFPEDGTKFHAQRLDAFRLLIYKFKSNPMMRRSDSSMGHVYLSAISSFSTLLLLLSAIWVAAIFAAAFAGPTSIEVAVELSFAGVGLTLLLSMVRRLHHVRSTLHDLVVKHLKQLERNAGMNRPSLQHMLTPNYSLYADLATQIGPDRALQLGLIFDFFEHFEQVIEDRDMYYVEPNIIRRVTKASKLSYAELAGPSTVKWFVSHYWGMPFRDTVVCLQKHAEEVGGNAWRSEAYWICTFSNNQWKLTEEIPKSTLFLEEMIGVTSPKSQKTSQLNECSFYKAMRSGHCKGTCMILDQQVLPLTRSWCLFELLQTFKMKQEKPEFAGLFLLTKSGVLNTGKASADMALAVAQALTTINLEDASATDKEDESMIKDMVTQDMGFFAANKKLKEEIRSILDVVGVCFEHGMNHVKAQLDLHISKADAPEASEAPEAPEAESEASTTKDSEFLMEQDQLMPLPHETQQLQSLQAKLNS